ncbi:hypothetical protein CH267_00400 [Rhodococcus sp. 06-621-2]|nr:fumarylacetoacetate hydrolase family protein [Rhodococcus sp. 06-621-2]OZC62847.1 hypothetical protein CH267_00400 [Rhodococcus sp. 06-621-2]
MKIVTFERDTPRVGLILESGAVLDLAEAAHLLTPSVEVADQSIFTSTLNLFAAGPEGLDDARRVLDTAWDRRDDDQLRQAIHDAPRLLAPVPRPPRARDFLTSVQHARKLQMPVFALEQMPVSYQANHLAIVGPEAEIVWPAYTDQLDYELEPAIVVGAPGRNIAVSDALSHIAGVTIWNDVSARDIQALEMTSLVGPAKGKNFCNVIGPCVATLDEVEIDAFELESRVNGEIWGPPKHWAAEYGVAEVLAWASWEEDIHPGEILALGTVGHGCGVELDRWIQPGDVIELEMAGVGVLRNVVGSRRARGAAGLPTFTDAPRRDPKKPRNSLFADSAPKSGS